MRTNLVDGKFHISGDHIISLVALNCFGKHKNSIETIGDRGDHVGDVRITALLDEIFFSIFGQRLGVTSGLVVHLYVGLRREGSVLVTLNCFGVTDLVLVGDIILHVSP